MQSHHAENLQDLQNDQEALAISNARGSADFGVKHSDRFPELWQEEKLLIFGISCDIYGRAKV